MTVTATSFRAAFPAFKDPATYTDPEIAFWIAFALLRHNTERWGDLLDMGVQLFVAHNLSLEYNALAAQTSGQGAGAVVGILTSVNADGVSWARSAPQTRVDDGHWALTSYGMRWREMARMMGAGGLQIGVPSPNDLAPGSAWPGVGYPPAWG